MKLTPREKDKLLISLAAIVAKNRLSKGIKLNYPEAIACLLYTSPSPRDRSVSRMPSSA